MFKPLVSHRSIRGRLFLLRLAFLYLLFYVYPNGFEYVHLHEGSLDSLFIWPQITGWFGEQVLGWEMDEYHDGASSDSRFEYARILLAGILSLCFSLLWLLVDRVFKISYPLPLKTIFLTLLRYHLSFIIILYGIIKVVPLQFSLMGLSTLSTAVGDQSPMGLLWTFMCYSPLYAKATGWVEMIAGVLLLFRRTTYMGGLLALVAMVNVVIIDIAYDVPVKTFAIHLLVFTIWVLWPNRKRLFQHLWGKDPYPPYAYPSLFAQGNRSRNIGLFLKGILLVAMSTTTLLYINERVKNELQPFAYPDLQMHLTVTAFERNGEASTLKNLPWTSLCIGGIQFDHELLEAKTLNGYSEYYQVSIDTFSQRLSFYPYMGDSTDLYSFHYAERNDHFYLEGTYHSDTLVIETLPRRIEDFYLMDSGTNWIQDY